MKLKFTFAKQWQYALFFMLLIAAGNAKAQCAPTTINISYQYEVDSFIYNYPGCTQFGTINITGQNIYDLNPLSFITSATTINITNTSITSVGLTGLQTLSANLRVNGNNQLASLDGLQNLTSVGNLRIYNNSILSSIAAVENVSSDVLTNLQITNNYNLSVCNYSFICNYFMTGKPKTISNNGWSCYDASSVTDGCSNPIIPANPTSPTGLPQILPVHCGAQVPNVYSDINALQLPQAQMYRFKIGDFVFDKPFPSFNFSELPYFLSSQGMPHSVRVAIMANGQWGAYGPACIVYAPAGEPLPQVDPLVCGTQIPSLQTVINVAPVPGAQQYYFRIFTNTHFAEVYKSVNYFTLSDFPTLIYYPNQTVTVYVMAMKNGNLGMNSDLCSFNMPPALPCAGPLVQNQTFCMYSTVAKLFAVGTNLKWYESAAGGTALAPSKVLVNGTYYVTQTTNNCESVRVPFNVALTNCGTTIENHCGATVNFYTPLYAFEVPNASHYRFRVSYWDGFPEFPPASVILEKTVRSFSLNEVIQSFPNPGYGAYQIEVSTISNGQASSYGPMCTVYTPPTPTARILPQYCGTTVSFTAVIYAEGVPLATDYRFRFYDGANYTTFTKSSRYFTVNEIEGYTYGKTYSVEVAPLINGWGEYGPACNINTPVAPTSQLANGYCNATMPKLKSVVYAVGVPQATRYRFRIVNGANTYILENTARYFILSKVPGNTYSRTYTVEVATEVNGAWSDYGNACTVSTPNSGTSRPGAANTDNVATDAEIQNATEAIILTSYPNPYTEDFIIEMNTQSAEKVSVRVFDMNGRLMEDQAVAPDELSSRKLGNGYASGIYNVVVTQGDYQKAFKVVKK